MSSDNDHERSRAKRQEEHAPPGIDLTVPSISRVYDFMLGGKDNFAIDRQVAEMALRIAPEAPAAAQANRGFLKRAVRHLAAEAGIDQFLDIGSGLPTRGNVHEIAHAANPNAHVVYVDNDPIVLVHGRALLASGGTSTVIKADIRDVDDILGQADVRKHIDFTRPVALLLLSILHHLNDDENPGEIAARFRDALPPGSYLAISHFYNPEAEHPEAANQAARAEKLFNEHLGTGRWRTREELLPYFGDMELLAPGLVPVADWRPDPGDTVTRGVTHHTLVGGVARKN